MNKKQRQQWKRMRAWGTWRYVVVLGVLWGLIITPLSELIEYFLFSNELRLVDILIKLPFHILGGFAFFLLMWHFAEQRYKISE